MMTLARWAQRLFCTTDRKVLRKFVWNFGWKGARSVRRFRQRSADGVYFPAFLFISVTNSCNLKCQGCWSTPSSPPAMLSPEILQRIIRESNEQGTYFFGILGGEPLLYQWLFDVIAGHPESYFLLFTNGTVLSEDHARRMKELGNVSPLVSIEGLARVSDERRGGAGVFEKALRGLKECVHARLVTGVATSVCQSNFSELVSEAFARDLVRRGVHYLWYYIYRPVGPNPSPELALNESQILELRRFMVELRARIPLLVVDAYWDHDGQALCPAAVGISHHINPWGDVEPCPPIQFARECVSGNGGLFHTVSQSDFLKSFREYTSSTTRGCILMEDASGLSQGLKAWNARDCTGRGRGFEELSGMSPCAGHHLPGKEIPEIYWPYRVAKKYWLFGFGAYG